MDKNILDILKKERKRQYESIRLIPSENYTSKDVMSLCGSCFMNKYSEGYPGKRYYQGNFYIDKIESYAVSLAKKLFGVEHANVQPYSGSPANSAVLFALAGKEDKIMGLSLDSGGHLTHGHPDITFSGKFFKPVQFKVDKKGFIDYKLLEKLAIKEKPKVMIVGTTAYPMVIKWRKVGEIADKIGAYFVADIAHIAGLIAGKVYPSPVRYCHIMTTTTHKTLRGPRGGMIMVTKKGLLKDKNLAQKIDKAVFPGLQGGPHNNTTAAIAQALYEAGRTSFKKYAKQIIVNAKCLAGVLKGRGLDLICGGTESHLMVIDLRKLGLSGNIAAISLEAANIIVNRNSVPYDNMPPFYPSGIRLGTPSVTTRGMKEKEMKLIGDWIADIIYYVKGYKLPPKNRKKFIDDFSGMIEKDKFIRSIKSKVIRLTKKFPVYV